MRIMRGRRMRYIVNTTVTGQFAGPNLPQVHVFDLLAGIVISIVLRQDFAYGRSYCTIYSTLGWRSGANKTFMFRLAACKLLPSLSPLYDSHLLLARTYMVPIFSYSCRTSYHPNQCPGGLLRNQRDVLDLQDVPVE